MDYLKVYVTVTQRGTKAFKTVFYFSFGRDEVEF